jgi:hypothetical protein
VKNDIPESQADNRRKYGCCAHVLERSPSHAITAEMVATHTSATMALPEVAVPNRY